MNATTLKQAAEDARRFLKLVKEVEAVMTEIYSHPKETGALRRASMDLTRSLAAMRKPN